MRDAGADDPAALRLVLGCGDLAESGDHGVGDDDVSLAGLAVGEAQDAAVPVDLVPLEVADLAVAHAGQGEQADGPHGVGLDVAGLVWLDRGGFGELGLEALALVGGQEALDGSLLEPSCTLGRVAAGGHVPQLGFGEHHAQHGARIVGGAVHVLEAVVPAPVVATVSPEPVEAPVLPAELAVSSPHAASPRHALMLIDVHTFNLPWVSIRIPTPSKDLPQTPRARRPRRQA